MSKKIDWIGAAVSVPGRKTWKLPVKVDEHRWTVLVSEEAWDKHGEAKCRAKATQKIRDAVVVGEIVVSSEDF
ncbi:MAG: hypothetical protein ABI488_01175 [Polyangiaceae bacterium]